MVPTLALSTMRRFPTIRSRAVPVLVPLTLSALFLASCGGATPGRGAAATSSSEPSTAAPTVPPPTTTTVPVEPGWTPVATGPHGVIADQRNVTLADGRTLTVIRFRAGQVLFNLHIGSQDPPTGTAVLGPESQSAVSATELPRLLAAFNGGFKANAGAGGVEVDGQTLTPLVPGLASFVIDADGTGRIGVWGTSVPVPGEQVASVRQNLPPLLEGGTASSHIGDPSYWGAVLHGVEATARSALGEDAAGDILYAASPAALPIDLATALADDGATVAMELDINPEWVQLDLARTAGGSMVAVVPSQSRPADQYLVGWTRDFVTVLAPAG